MSSMVRMVAIGCCLLASACGQAGGPAGVAPRPSDERYRAGVLSADNTGVQVGNQGNVQPQTQIGSNTQQLFIFVFGNNNVVTVDQSNLMPFLNLNWVNQSLAQAQRTGDSVLVGGGGPQWDAASLAQLLAPNLPATGPGGVSVSNQTASANPTPSPSAATGSDLIVLPLSGSGTNVL